MAEGVSLRRLGLIFGLALGLWSVAAAPARAADYYVDGDNANPNDCSFANPCDLISEAIDLADDDDASPDLIHVAPKAAPGYTGISVTDSPMTLVGNDYAGDGVGATTLINGVAVPAVVVEPGAAARTVRNFNLQGGTGAPLDDSTVRLDTGADNVTIQDNLLTEGGGTLSSHIYAEGSPTIRGNVIFGTEDPASGQSGIRISAAVAPQVIGNFVNGVERSISITGNTDAINVARNTLIPSGDDSPPAAGIYLNGVGGIATANGIIPGAGLDNANGIYIEGNSPGERRLSRNQIFQLPREGVFIGTMDPVSLNGDVIAGNGEAGIANDFIISAGMTATNVTVVNNDATGTLGEISLGPGAEVALDSSIVGDDGVQKTAGPAVVGCTAAFSRGPAAYECLGQFATSAPPNFVSPGGNNYALTAANPALIDMGNPALPAPGTLDLSGGPRSVDGITDSVCLDRRDIGADELDAPASSCPVPAAATPAAAPLASAAKCPPGKKLVTVKKGKKKKKKCVRRKKRRRR